MHFSHLGVFLISVKPLTTEITENKTTPKICKITVNAREQPLAREGPGSRLVHTCTGARATATNE